MPTPKSNTGKENHFHRKLKIIVIQCGSEWPGVAGLKGTELAGSGQGAQLEPELWQRSSRVLHDERSEHTSLSFVYLIVWVVKR